MATQAAPEKSASRRSEQMVAYDRYIDQQLRKAQGGVKAVDVAAMTMLLLAGGLAYFFLMALVDHWLVPGGLGFVGRFMAWTVLIGGGVWFLATRLLPVLFGRINPIYAADTIERSSPSLKNSLLNFVFLRTHHDELPEPVYDAVEQQAATGLSRVPVEHAIDRTSVIRIGYLLAGVLVLFALYFVFSPKNPFTTASRVMLPWADILPPSRVEIEDIQPGSTIAVRGEKLKISAQITGLGDDEPVMVYYTTDDGQAVDRGVPMYLRNGETFFQCELPASDEGLSEALVYRIEAGDARSHEYRVEVVSAPTIAVQSIDYDYPAYTGLLDRRFVREGDLKGLEGTEVTIHAQANQPIADAWIDLGNDRRRNLTMKIDGDRATARLQLALKKDGRTPRYSSYVLRFKNEQGWQNREPVEYKIEVTPDLPPEVVLLAPEEKDRDIELPLDGSLEIEAQALDPDFGLNDVTLLGQVGDRTAIDRKLLEKERRGQFIGRYALVPRDEGLNVGDVVDYWVRVADNKEPEPNTAETEHYRFTVVSPDQPQQDQLAQNDQQPNPDQKQNPDQQPNQQQQPDQKQEPGEKQQPGEKQPDQGGQGEKQKQDGNSGGQQGAPQDDQSGGEGTPQQPPPGGESQDNPQSGGGQGGEESAGQAGGEKSQDQQGGSADDQQGTEKQPSGGQPEAGDRQQPGGQAGSEGQERESQPQPTEVPKNGADDGSAIERLSKLAEEEKQREQQPGERQPSQQHPSDSLSEGLSQGEQTDQQDGSSGEQPGESSGQRPNVQERPGEKQTPGSGRGEGEKQPQPKQGAGEQQPESKPDQETPDGSSGQRPKLQEEPDDGRGQQPGGSDGDGAKSKPGDAPKQKPQDGGERSKAAGGDPQHERGNPGAGNQGTDAAGSPDPQTDIQPSNDKQDPGGGEKSEEGSPKSPAHGKKESNSDSSEGGDKAGGGDEGGGQQANRHGTGSAGQNTASDEGGGRSEQAGGKGETSDQGGDDVRSEQGTDKAGEKEAGEGDRGKSRPSADGGQKQGPSAEGDKGRPDGQPGEGAGHKQPQDRRPPQGEGDPRGEYAGGESGSQPTSNEAGDEANLEYAREATDLSLEYLDDVLKKDQVPPELRETMPGWTKDDFARLRDRIAARKQQAEQAGPRSEAARREFNDWLRSLGIGGDRNRTTARGAQDRNDAQAGQREAARSNIPAEYLEQVEAYKRGLFRSSSEQE